MRQRVHQRPLPSPPLSFFTTIACTSLASLHRPRRPPAPSTTVDPQACCLHYHASQIIPWGIQTEAEAEAGPRQQNKQHNAVQQHNGASAPSLRWGRCGWRLRLRARVGAAQVCKLVTLVDVRLLWGGWVVGWVGFRVGGCGGKGRGGGEEQVV